MSHQPQVATKVSVGTKVAVAVLLLAGLGALGYASGYVKLDYQQSKASADKAAEQCDCLYECAVERQECLKQGNTAEDCNSKVGVCLDECLPKEEPKDTCTESCKQTFDQCKQAGGTNEECAEEGADCLCECDPWFAPTSADNSCVDSCKIKRQECEQNVAGTTGSTDCVGLEQSCLNECDPWCEDRGDDDEQKLPDLVISDIKIEADGVLTIKSENKGSEVTDTSGHTTIYIDGNKEWDYAWSTLTSTNFLAAGGSDIVQPQYLKDFQTIKACIDTYDVIVESDENNCLEVNKDGDDQDKPDDSSNEPEDSDLTCPEECEDAFQQCLTDSAGTAGAADCTTHKDSCLQSCDEPGNTVDASGTVDGSSANGNPTSGGNTTGSNNGVTLQ